MKSRRKNDRAEVAVRIVAEVGNARLKWGVCDDSSITDKAALAPDDHAAWNAQLKTWKLTGPIEWAVSGVHPKRRDDLLKWLEQRGDKLHLISSHKQLHLKTTVPNPEKVGIDRLLNAVAVNSRRQKNIPAVIVDAGTAITIDYLDGDGVFQGGAIMPGIRMMARALHTDTALLPLIDVDVNAFVPGTSTVEAMSAGIMCAAIGGVNEFIASLMDSEPLEVMPQVFIGGGDGHVFESEFDQAVTLWPEMTLEGMRIAAWPESGK